MWDPRVKAWQNFEDNNLQELRYFQSQENNAGAS